MSFLSVRWISFKIIIALLMSQLFTSSSFLWIAKTSKFKHLNKENLKKITKAWWKSENSDLMWKIMVKLADFLS